MVGHVARRARSGCHLPGGGRAARRPRDTAVEDVVPLTRDRDGWVASIAPKALARAGRRAVELGGLARSAQGRQALLLRGRADAPGTRAPRDRSDHRGRNLAPTLQASLRTQPVVAFVLARIEAGEPVDVPRSRGFLKTEPGRGSADPEFVKIPTGTSSAAIPVATFEQWRTLAVLAGSLGRVWTAPYDQPAALCRRPAPRAHPARR